MKMEPDQTIQPSSRSGFFPRTPWTQLMQLRGSGAEANEALGKVCGLYWRPLCLQIRSKGFDPHDAEDLTQDFLSKLIVRKDLSRVERSRGKLRSYLYTALAHFLANVWRDRRAEKRGSGASHVPLDENQMAMPDPLVETGPDAAFDRQWALTLLDNVLNELREDFTRRGRREFFDLLAPALTWTGGDQNLDELGAQLGLSVGAARVAVHRLRLRYRNTLFSHIAATVEREDQVAEEIRDLMAILRRDG